MKSYHQFFISILVCCITTNSYAFFASDIPKLNSKKYNSNSRVKSLRHGGGVKGRTSPQHTSPVKIEDDVANGVVYEGGCTVPPKKPAKSKLRCSFYSGCALTCEDGYDFPGGEVQTHYVLCKGGKWVLQDTESEELPSCQPVCSPPCQNQGICVEPDQCECPDKFTGPQCQFENKPCLELPPLPKNSRRMCRKNKEYCRVTCFEGHQFPDGSSVATLTCKNGIYVPGRNDWVSIPDCQATCTPPCQNGGVCLSLNVCQCPQEFRGTQCQYTADQCKSSKLNFNGGYNCSGDLEQFTCTGLFCAEGMKMTHEPAPSYTCKYSEGTFYPADVPTCVWGDLGDKNSTGKESIGDDDKETNKNVIIENKLPKSGVCYTWSGVHYKTFDERIYSFDSKCTYILVKDSIDNTFSITVNNSKSCYDSSETVECHRVIQIYIQGKEYKLYLTETGNAVLAQNDMIVPIPGQAVGIRTETTSRYIKIILDSVGVILKWDKKTFIQVKTKESLWNRTEGLCGNIDGNSDNDIVTVGGRKTKNVVTAAASWQVDDVGSTCKSTPIEKRECTDDASSNDAHSFCLQLLSDPRFSNCSKAIDKSQLMQACTWDFCSCKSAKKSDCACDTMNVYISECKFKGLISKVNWRDSETCPLTCTRGKVYQSCGSSKNQLVCGSSADTNLAVDAESCEEGCFCPKGKVLHNDECILPSKCPCKLRTKEFPPGSSVPKDCNTCTCENGHWVCTQVSCGARCSAVGDPHYTTFDGKKYDFMGKCSYYLLKTKGLSIETENVACPGAISEMMSYTKTSSAEQPSCTKTATIHMNGTKIKLRQNGDVLINGQELTKLPFETAGISIRSISSVFLQVNLPSGIEIWWDGLSRLYIDIPASFKEQTKGLCGTFNSNQKDDFITPEGDIEQSVISFANKWKTHEACSNVVDKITTHPCEEHMHRRGHAEKLCSRIKSELFSDCHFHVDPEQHYHDCLYDVCSCQGNLDKCLCTIISSYAHECAANGINIDWRDQVRECGIQCTNGQKYQVCGDSCTRTCYDISTRPNCKKQCVEGCNCPVGEALDSNGECIPIGQCKCYSNGLVFNPGYKEIRRIEKYPELCTCVNGGWNCDKATQEEIDIYPDTADLKNICNETAHLVFTECEPAEPKTCKNMDSYERSTPAVCQYGCQCKKGFVLDTTTKQCIRPSQCPCHHGGKSYKENDIVQSDCNTCTCKNGKWSCTDRTCAAECSSWGDSHYKTFDGKHYDYQGQCDYVLAKGALGENVAFDVSIQNVPCGTLGTTCSKSISIRVAYGKSSETITLSVGKPLPKDITSFDHLSVREIGLYVIVEAPTLGLSVRWDRGTRVYVRLHPKWKNEVKGLCGNYNDNELDDFQTPSGGVTEVSPFVFGDSWKLEPYCPEAKLVVDTCTRNPERKVWATQKCGILKSHLFMPCHSEVPIDSYYEKCLFDTCACDQGGDCECLCTALAAYAQECNNRGVPIHWRSQELCPIQCEERCSVYKPCISTCLVETCDNIYTRNLISATCIEDTCVEGCELKPCPVGQVYFNSSYDRCVPSKECRSVCMEIEGVTYYEGDIIEEDECHTCYCSRRRKICKGKPCEEVIVSPTPIVTIPEDQELTCVTGWSEWINQDPIQDKERVKHRNFEREPLPDSIVLNKLDKGGKCSKDKMTNIRCRTVDTHISAKETGLDAECSLEQGLVCKQNKKGGPKCPDFEIQVYCECETTPSTQSPSTPEPIKCEVTSYQKDDDCHGYFTCKNGPDGAEYFEQTCGETMMYNPKTLSCDRPDVVALIRPECEVPTVPTESSSTSTTTETPEKPKCNKETLNRPHPTDCSKYLVCKDGPDGAEYIEKTCKGSMLYNPETYTCDTVENVREIKPECDNRCPPELKFNKCAISCVDLCLYYEHNVKVAGFCRETLCEPGCVGEDVNEMIVEKKCTGNKRWANNDTCVDINDCMCVSKDGKPVKPGSIYKESDCEVCQCVHNFYICDDSACKNETVYELTLEPITITEIPTVGEEHSEEIVVVNTVTPPPECDLSFEPIISTNIVRNVKYTASSSKKGAEHQPDQSRIDNEDGSWVASKPKSSFLRLELDKRQPIYGIQIKGNPKRDEYVTSFKVQYSIDGYAYSSVIGTDLSILEIRGSIDRNTLVNYVFPVPIEAKFVKILPSTWHKNVALRVDLLGCEYLSTTTEIPTPQPPICTDDMGPSTHEMREDQISVSSFKNVEHGKNSLDISENSWWEPFVDSPNEWIQFDLKEPRNLTGFSSKGGKDGWVEAFKVKFSHDGDSWNSIVDKDSNEKVFPANYDTDSSVTNYFELPVQARYIRLIPIKWHKKIQVRVELIGCYKPYPTEATESTTTTTEASIFMNITGGEEIVTSAPCNYCPGVKSEIELEACECTQDMWWNGTDCVYRPLCPCIVGKLVFPPGNFFNKDDCSECVCKIGGVVECTSRKCFIHCQGNSKTVLNSKCDCQCEPCPKGERICPTSNICINEDLWCDGIVHCEDDEIDCKKEITTTPTTTTTEEEFIVEEGTPEPRIIGNFTDNEFVCPKFECPPGFKKVQIFNRKYYSSRYSLKGSTKGRLGVKGVKVKDGAIKSNYARSASSLPVPLAQISKWPECVQYKCVSDKVPPPFENRTCIDEECPEGYDKVEEEMTVEEGQICPGLVCRPEPVPDTICEITGRTFVTFDGTEYRYDICDHVIARDLWRKEWIIILSKNCTSEKCSRDLHIQIKDDNFVFHPDLTVEYKGYLYTVNQLKKIGAQNGEFIVTKVGNVIAFTSLTHGFWIEWDIDGNVKVGVVASLIGKVDGLCGYFDKDITNDKQKPGGELSKTVDEFGDSWKAINETRPECKINTCPADLQNKAWQLCNTLRDNYLSSCSNAVDIDASVSRCLDTACECLMSNENDKCKCDLLQNFVVECLTHDHEVEISGWRGKYDCPTSCPPPLVHKDCYRRRCEPTCESLSDPKQCPKVNDACYPGCYCPDEMVRKDDICIKPSECRDCECKVTGQLDFLTYDETNFTMAGNCVYVLTRDAVNSNFEILITNMPCKENEQKTCIQQVTILDKTHMIHIQNESPKIKVDSKEVTLSETEQFSDWASITQQNDEIKVVLKSDQVEIRVKLPLLGVTVRAPSYKYGAKLEGLCGDCNRKPEDDLRLINGSITENIEDFSLDWLYDKSNKSRELCKLKENKECKPLPDSENPCVVLIDSKIFGSCHAVVDYTIYQEWCNKETCVIEGNVREDPSVACPVIESYAKACLKEGICVDWHFDHCPQPQCSVDKVWSSCGSSCVKTCESINAKEKVTTTICETVEGCFCPDGKVLKDNKCVEERECVVCDKDGHHPGDEWNIDICTNCTCDQTGNVMCHKKECPGVETICEQGYTPQKVVTDKPTCCDKYICVPSITTTPSPSCEPPQPVTCGKHKRIKLSKIDDTECYQNICECVPKHQCPPVDLNDKTTADPGLVAVVNENDCCAEVELVCKEELCPEPPKCPEFYVVKTEKVEKDGCCATHTCVPPPNKCIVELKYIAAENGGERPRKADEITKILKNPSETWNDGPCRHCQCLKATEGESKIACTETQCPSIVNSDDYGYFELKAEMVYNQCCPKFVRTGCKSKGKIHDIGDEWIEDDDYCIKYKCNKNAEGDVIKEVQVTSCGTNCTAGSVYVPPKASEKKCCGSCKTVSCVVDDVIKQPGDEWTSDDYCTKYKCLNNNGTMQLITQEITCGKISQETLTNYVVKTNKVAGKCCEEIEIVSCKVGDKIYEVDETWTKDDPCKRYKCSKIADSKLAIVEYETKCNTTCPSGYSYVEPDVNENKCCGFCRQAACIVDGQIRAIGETWHSDDFCTKMTCKNTNGMLQVEKSIIRCRELPQTVYDNYVVKSEKVDGSCCNKTEIVACKNDGKVYKPGETWTVGNELCNEYKCVQVGENLGISITEITCKKQCPHGYKYVDALPSEKTCCGKCVQDACIHNDTVRQIGEEWTSDDHCQTYKCESVDGGLQISKTNIICKPLPEETLRNYVIESRRVRGQCCNETVVVACKGNNRTYNPGDTWTDGENKCKSFECIKIGENLGIKEYISTCNTTCPTGFDYVAPAADDPKCCGKCVQTKCMINDEFWEIGQQWESKDHCESYSCRNSSGVIQIVTSKTICHPPPAEVERNFLIQSKNVEGQCCPDYEIVACKVGDILYQIGDSWNSNDPCTTVNCTRNDQGQVIKRDVIEVCKKECDKGFEYEEPTQNECCGKCVARMCVINGTLHKPGETWTSLDGCTKLTCEKIENKLVITGQSELCPSLNNCPPERIYSDGCCKRCNTTGHEKVLELCGIETVPLEMTKDLIKLDNYQHGACVNDGEIPNLTQCVGSCESSVLFEKSTSMHVSTCTCCQALDYKKITVPMICSDGFRYDKSIDIPSVCSCNGCQNAKANLLMSSPTKTRNRKMAVKGRIAGDP